MTTTPREKDALIVRYLPMIREVAWCNLSIIGQENYEEMESDCMMAVSRAIDAYVDTMRCKMDTYVYRAIENSVMDTMRRYNGKESTAVRVQNIPFTDEYDTYKPDTPDKHEPTTEAEIMYRSIINGVENRRHRRILVLSSQGLTYAEIGRKMGISRERVRQIHDAAIAGIRRSMDK